jgi:hypothetical protein
MPRVSKVIKKELYRASDSLQKFTRKNPGKALLMAAGAGIVAEYFITKPFRRRSWW